MLRSLFDKDKISSQSIKEIYGPVDGSADEINQVAEYLSPLKSKNCDLPGNKILG